MLPSHSRQVHQFRSSVDKKVAEFEAKAAEARAVFEAE